jgi:hypothetical protein
MSSDIHDKLVQAYLNYFSANERWEDKNSVRTTRETRRWLREIRILAKERMDQIQHKHQTERITRKDKT